MDECTPKAPENRTRHTGFEFQLCHLLWVPIKLLGLSLFCCRVWSTVPISYQAQIALGLQMPWAMLSCRNIWMDFSSAEPECSTSPQAEVLKPWSSGWHCWCAL